MRVLWIFVLAALITGQSGCAKATTDVQTLVTDDCGRSWRKIDPGETIPLQLGSCKYAVTIPDYPMEGKVAFRTAFKNRVRADIEISYWYVIVDAEAFIREAKHLARNNADGDDAAARAERYDSTERFVIDRRIREIVTESLPKEDVVTFSQTAFEDRLLTMANEWLKSRGVRLHFLSLVPTLDVQTALAIDTVAAMKIYESACFKEVGKAVAVARAGATTQIQINACGAARGEGEKDAQRAP